MQLVFSRSLVFSSFCNLDVSFRLQKHGNGGLEQLLFHTLKRLNSAAFCESIFTPHSAGGGVISEMGNTRKNTL